MVRELAMPARLALGPKEAAAITEVLNYYQNLGRDPGYQDKFEVLYTQEFVKKMGGGHADAVATGTAALYIAIASLALPAGSEVLVSPITDPGTISAIILNGLKPRLMDSAPGSFNIGLEQFSSRITNDVRAVVVVHSLGRAVDIGDIVKLARSRNIKIVEDCSQSHGARYNNAPVGTFGDIAAFSTMYRKAHISGGCGGLVYTRDEDLFRLALAHADRGKPQWKDGFDERDPDNFLFPALNLNSNEISCAIGRVSLSRLEETILKRLGFLADLTGRLLESSAVCAPYGYSPNDSPFVYPIMVDEDRLNCNKADFAKAVAAEGIGLNPDYRYIASDWRWLKKYLSDDFICVNAADMRNKSFMLYLNENYTKSEAVDICRAIKKNEELYLKT